MRPLLTYALRLALITAALIFAFPGCDDIQDIANLAGGDSDYPIIQCTQDLNCPDDYVCYQGVCIPNEDNPCIDAVECAIDTDCANDEYCDSLCICIPTQVEGGDGDKEYPDQDIEEMEEEQLVDPCDIGPQIIAEEFLDFGHAPYSVEAVKTLHIANLCPDRPLTVTNIEILSTSDDFSLLSPPEEPVTLNGLQDILEQDVVYQPSDIGVDEGEVVVSSNDPDGIFRVTLITRYKGIPRIDVSPNPLDFREVLVGDPAAERTLLVKNLPGEASDNAVLRINNIYLESNESAAFELDGFLLPLYLGQESETEISVLCRPPSSQVFSDRVVFESNDPDDAMYLVDVSCMGIEPILSVESLGEGNLLDFGLQRINTPVTVNLSLSNSGGGILVVSPPELANWSSPAFGIDTSAFDGYEVSLVGGESVVLPVTFLAMQPGDHTGQILIPNNQHGAELFSVNLMGRATAAQVLSDPYQIDFPAVLVGEADTKPLTLINAGELPVTIMAISFANQTEALAFGENDELENILLNPDDIHELQITFAPPARGVFNNMVHFSTDDAVTTESDVQINAVGIAPVIRISERDNIDFVDELLFGEVRLDHQAGRILDIANVGDAILTVTGVELTANSLDAEFSFEDIGVVELAQSQSQALTVSYAPVNFPGQDLGAVAISSDDPANGLVTVVLKGLATDQRLSISPLDLLEFPDTHFAAVSTERVRLGNPGLVGVLLVESVEITEGAEFFSVESVELLERDGAYGLNPGGLNSLAVDIVFNPPVPTTREAAPVDFAGTLRIVSNSYLEEETDYPLAGRGIPCPEGYWDLDDDPQDCEYRCDLSNEGVEICDNKDNDCNNIIDDGPDVTGNCTPPENATAFCDESGSCDFNCVEGHHRCDELCFADDDPEHCGEDCIDCPDDDYECTYKVCIDGSCDYAIEDDRCFIEDACYAFNDEKAENICRICIPYISLTEWSDREDGVFCDDGLYCTVDDACLTGQCVSETERDCGEAVTEPQCQAPRCNEDDDSCYAEAANEGESCDDGDPCTMASTCNGEGECVGVPLSWIGTPCDGVDEDLCEEGLYECDNGEKVCTDDSESNIEFCNDDDDDCNPETPDGAHEAWWEESCDGEDLDLCHEGIFLCEDGAKICSDASEDNIEVCNGEDDDCDDDIDEDVKNTYFRDFDGDNYGDPNNSAEACNPPEGYVSDNTDCNDYIGAIHPDAPESCNGIDDDCDDVIDNGVLTVFYRDFDEDSYGDPNISAEACSAPVGYVADNTDCNDENHDINPGVGEICNGLDDNCDDNIDEGVKNRYYRDFDGDRFGDPYTSVEACTAPEGYVSDHSDCNDYLQTVYPGAREVCNGIDDDCNDQIDDGVLNTYYRDFDTDGYGDPDISIEACSVSAGYAEDNTDCDDGSSSIHPGADEVCNGVDDDCDDQIDEDAKITFYRDYDEDGYGDPADTAEACSAPDGYVADDQDCDDILGSVHPGAEEVCNGIDDNCDDQIDEGVKTQYFRDYDTDGHGDPNTSTQACSPPAGYVLDNSDCNDYSKPVHPGAAETCNGIDDNCDDQIDEGVKNTYYRDYDTDGYGNPNNPMEACSTPRGYVSDDTDCNDYSININPGKQESCNGIDDNCNDQIDEGVKNTYYLDHDTDSYGDPYISTEACTVPAGYVSNNTDCNDDAFSINPGVGESCNGIDDNCNDQIDEGVKNTYYRDYDIDGFGNPEISADACSAPAGYVADDSDCNDSNFDIHPGAAEFCNGLDDNCNDQIDEGVKTTYFRDYDIDGYGDPNTSTQACAPPSGYLLDNTDCNDYSHPVHPGADEVCNGVDDNCNDEIDEYVKNTYYRDYDNDGYGNPENSTEACSAPSGYVSDSTDCNDYNGDINPDGTEICNLADDDCDDLIDEDENGDPLSEPCYTGASGTEDVGICHGGVKTCSGGYWGYCAGQVTPQMSDPPDSAATDSNCDGIDGEKAVSVFVSTAGSDSSSTCSFASPCRTIGHGIEVAVNRAVTDVLVRKGNYSEKLDLNSSHNGIGVYGGYGTSWTRGDHSISAYDTNISGGYHSATGQYLTVRAQAAQVKFANIELIGHNASGAYSGYARSSYIAHVTSNSVLLFENVTFTQGAGVGGGGGANGASASSSRAPDGSDGSDNDEFATACGIDNGASGGGRGANSCSSTTYGGNGGKGGSQDTCCAIGICGLCDCAATSGSGGNNAGNSGSYYGKGGGGGGQCTNGVVGQNGKIGANGNGGSGSNGGGTIFNGLWWVGKNGGNGALGGYGSGGGGGGGGGGCDSGTDSTGAGGGGGASGGCRASSSGTGGKGGGGSFGIFGISSIITATDCTFNRGNGGNGGGGGDGGSGQPGGIGGDGGGGPGEGDGGDGGDGGRGGHSGGGGGGDGGLSYGIFTTNCSVTQSENSFSGGSAGYGGSGGAISGGNPGGSGAGGVLGTVGIYTP